MIARVIAVVALVLAAGTGLAQHGQKLDSHQLAVRAHPKDPTLQAEHAELLDLINPDNASATAIRDGAWSDPRTWKDGTVPPGKGAPQADAPTCCADIQPSLAIHFGHCRLWETTPPLRSGSSFGKLRMTSGGGIGGRKQNGRRYWRRPFR